MPSLLREERIAPVALIERGVVVSCLNRLSYVAVLSSLMIAGELSAAPADGEIEPEKIFRGLDHFISNEEHRRFELTPKAQPFVDWGLVHPGFVEYLSKQTGEIVPLNDPHPYEDEEAIRKVTFGEAQGVRLRVQKPLVAGKFAEMLGTTYPWERGEIDVNTLIHDEEQQLYRVWYKVAGGTAYAESKDFRTWNKPLNKLKGFENHSETNLIGVTNLEEALGGVMLTEREANPGASGAFFIDPSAPPEERFKTTFLAHAKTPHYNDQRKFVDRPISAMTGPGSTVMFGAVAGDGMAWRILPRPLCYHDADTQTVTKYDPELKKYVAYTRLYELGRRTIGFMETADFKDWPLPVNALTPGPGEGPSLDFYSNAFSFYPGQAGIRMIFCAAYDRTGDSSDLRLATSRNGRVFHFAPGEPVVAPTGRDEPGRGMLIPKPGLVRLPNGNLLLVYGAWRMPHKFPRHHLGKIKDRYYDLCAEWPADRMVALEAEEEGEFSTVPFVLRGNSISLNLATETKGGVEVEVRDEAYRPIPGRGFSEADRLTGDQTSLPVTWKGTSDLSAYRNRRIWLRFRLRQAKLYAIRAEE